MCAVIPSRFPLCPLDLIVPPEQSWGIILHQFKTQVIKSQVYLVHCYNVKNQLFICLPVHNKIFVPIYGTHHGNVIKLLVTILFLFYWPTWEILLAKTNSVKKEGREDLVEMKVNGLGWLKLGQERNSWQ